MSALRSAHTARERRDRMANDTKRKQQVQRAVRALGRHVAAAQQTSQGRDRLDVEVLGNIELGDGGKLGADRRRVLRA